MKKIFSILLFIFFSQMVIAQKDTMQFKKNAISLELLGNAGIGRYSLNYERNVIGGKNGFLSARIGISKGAEYYFPILLNGIFLNGKHHFEIGAGATLAYCDNCVPDQTFLYEDLFAYTANFMYRYQKPNGKLAFRVGWTPMLYTNNSMLIILFFDCGLSVGYAF